MPTNTTKATAQPLPIIAPPQVPQTVGGITTVSASVAPPVISSQTNAGQGIKAKPNTAPQTINAGTDKYLAQGMNAQQAYERSMKDYNVSKLPAPVAAPVSGSVLPATPNKPVVPEAPKAMETPPVPAGGAPMVTTPKPVATPMGKEQGTTGIYDSATPDQKAQADSMYNLIDPTASLSPAASKDIKDALASGDVSKIQAISNAYGIDAKQTASFVSAYRTTRDATLAANRADEVNQRNLDQASRSYSDAITKQKANVEAAANQMAMMQETSGRMRSRNMANGIIQAMDEQKRILDNLYQSKDWAFAEIASNAKYNHDILANNYNDAMSQFDQQVQNKIKNLSDTGMAKTADGLRMAQSAIEQAQLQKLALGAQYAQSLQQAVEITKMEIAQKTPDTEQTKLINDGYLHNAQGEVVMGPSGKPLVYNAQKEIRQIVDDGKGGKLAVYADGTTSQITEGQVATPEEIQNYVKAVNQNPSLFNALSDSIKPQVLAAIGKSVTAPSETAMMGYAYEVAKSGMGAVKDLPQDVQDKVLEIYANMSPQERAGVKAGQKDIVKMTDAQGNEILVDTNTMKVVFGPGAGTRTAQGRQEYGIGTTDFRGIAQKYPNVAAFKNNNPAGITWNASFDDPKPGSTAQRLIDAGITFHKGTARPANEGGNYVTFDSIEDGMAAQRIMMEGTYGNATVKNMLASWVGTAEGPAYARQVATAAGIDPNANVSDLTKEQLDSLQIAKLSKESPGLLKELSNAGIVENGRINFAQPQVFTPEQLATAQGVPEAAKSFAESAIYGGLSPVATETAPKEYTATQKVLFDKILSGKESAQDIKTMRQQGLTDADVNAYAASVQPSEELSDKKFTQYNQTVGRFASNPEVKAFESGMNSYGDLIASLKSTNGPGDTAAVFQFMKTLDPTSTVREGEFALAAKSAGVWEQFKNIPANKLEGTILTEDQRKAFGKLALKFIENKAKTYDTKYDDMARVLKSQGIPESYLPTKMSEQIRRYSGDEIQTASGNTYNLNDF